jgi:hypothetical protein
LVFAPDDPTVLYAGTDGGVFRAQVQFADNPQSPPVFESRNGGLAIAQITDLANFPAHDSSSTWAWENAIALQDNGTLLRSGGRTWNAVAGNDGLAVAIDPGLSSSGSPIVYDMPDANNRRSFERGSPDHALLGSGTIVGNPLRGGELLAMDAETFGDNSWRVAESMATTTAPAKWICAEPDTSHSSYWRVIEFAPNGTYYVGKSDGSLWSFTMSGSPAGDPSCAPQTNAAMPPAFIEIVAGAGYPTARVDPFDANSLYVAFSDSIRGRNVIQKLTRANSQSAWVATSIVGNFPRTQSLASKAGPYVALAADPTVPGMVYIGNITGLWEGTPQTNGSYTWALNQDIPAVDVRAVAAQRDVNGFSGIVRVGTFGRGAWERLPANGGGGGGERRLPLRSGLMTSGAPVSCIGCRLGNTAWVAVPYAFAGGAGDTAAITAVPLAGGVAQPYFLTGAEEVRPGTGSVSLPILYAAGSAPQGFHSDALRIEMTAPGRDPVTRTVPFDRWWLKKTARKVSVAAEILKEGPLPLAVPIRIAGEAATTGTTPLTVPARASARLTITAPMAVERSARLSHWTVNGAVMPARPAIQVTVQGDLEVTAHYVPLR